MKKCVLSVKLKMLHTAYKRLDAECRMLYDGSHQQEEACMTTNATPGDRPIIALAMGDPAGISAELTARVLALPELVDAAHIIAIGDRRILDEGALVAGIELDLLPISLEGPNGRDAKRHAFVDLAHLDPAKVIQGEASLAGGQFATRNFRTALELAHAGKADAVCFTPFNKKAMRYAYPGYDDEIRFVADVISFAGKVREFNVLERVWNARVTSHIPLSEVASSLSIDRILAELELTQSCLKNAGYDNPRIAVAGLNPHAGDGGSFGMEEINIIEPAVAKAQARGFDVQGPFPADTVFLRAIKEGFHAVLTMYHDQGQIAMKLMGFDKGVTMMGGLPFPLCTPAHGTAYDIAGKGIADVGASREALLLAARMAKRAAGLAAAA
jgi:4-hydroxythreonine-4-phosphate dehydrogenase